MFNNLEAEQARNGLTNARMSEMLGITRVTYEKKKKSGKFNLSEIKKICDILGCGFDYLFATDKTA
ncbi:MAG: helix-turn-helix domain-containing protein [Clostridia bacterium]|nr:helix-turn-helix domain-containing protein [Clostridia bacterium]